MSGTVTTGMVMISPTVLPLRLQLGDVRLHLLRE